jgi:hypothetical protein
MGSSKVAPIAVVMARMGSNVCFWHLADIRHVLIDVRFQGYSGHREINPFVGF